MDHLGDTTRIRVTVMIILSAIVVGGVIDVILDRPTTLWSAHILLEVTLIVVSLGTAVYLARGWYSASRRLRRSQAELARERAQQEAWRARAEEALARLGTALSEHFDAWGLTPAERRVAMGILRGWSHKRIARETGTSERTIRQHAVAVYRKSGLEGRARFSGFFLEGLMLPEEALTRDDSSATTAPPGASTRPASPPPPPRRAAASRSGR